MRTNNGEHEVAELRNLLNSHNLVAPILASEQLTAERTQQIYQVATSDRYQKGASGSPFGDRAFEGRSRARYHSSIRQSSIRFVLAACLVLGLAISFGYLYRNAGNVVVMASSEPTPTQTMLAGIPPLSFSLVGLNEVDAAPSAEQALDAARRIAAAAGQAGNGDIQFISHLDHLIGIEVRPNNTSAISTVAITRSDFWISPDGAARIDETWGPEVDVSQFSKLDVFGQLDVTAPIVGETTTTLIPAPTAIRHTGEGVFTPWVIADLPRDPAKLRTALLQLNRSCQLADDQCVIFTILMLNRQYVIPGDLAASMWQLLAEIPTVRDLGTTTDRIGRPALAFAHTLFPGESDEFEILLISPETGQLIGWEDVIVNDTRHNISEPTVVGFTIWLESRFVEKVGEYPANMLVDN